MNRRKGPAPTGNRPSPKSTAADASDNSVHAAGERRRQATYRSVPLDCGCRDPWLCRCTEPLLTERAVDGARDAAHHLLIVGTTPLLHVDALRALWRRGGDDRQLARELYELVGGES